MRQPLRYTITLSLTFTLTLTGCAFRPSTSITVGNGAESGEIQPVAPPNELIGKWRYEVKDATSTKTSVYHFQKDGRLEITTGVENRTGKVSDLVKRTIIKVDNDRFTMVDLSHTSTDGIEDVLPPERRRQRTLQLRVQGDELHWTEVAEPGKPTVQAKPLLLHRVKE